MLDEMKLFERVNRMIDTKNGILNESYTPFAGNVAVQIFVRSKYGGGGRGGNVSIHDCTVKIIIDGANVIELPVPVYPYSNIPSEKIRALYKNATKELPNLLNQNIVNSILSFIYDNQMWIRALWESKDGERGRIGSIPYDYLQSAILSSKYIGLSLSPKSARELEDDKEEIVKYVRKQLKDDSIQIDFGSVRGSAPKHKKKRR